MKKTGERILLSGRLLQLTIERLCQQLLESHNDFEDSVLIGLQPRGTFLADRMYAHLKELLPENQIKYGTLDISFYRDDFRRREDPIEVSETRLDFEIEDKRVILIDDVLFTGRSVRSAMDSLMDYGRPKDVEFLVLIDRRFSRQLPIQANYVGRTVDAVVSERVEVNLEGEGQVLLNSMEDES